MFPLTALCLFLLLTARGLAQGNPLFYAYTKKDTRSSDMVVHTANRRVCSESVEGEGGAGVWREEE